MAHLYSAELEQKLIVCALETRSPRVRALILAETDEDTFGSEYGVLARKRMNVLLQAGKSFGTALDFAEDAAISSSKGAVAFIKATPEKRSAAGKFNKDRVVQLVDQLKRYQQVRSVYSIQQVVNDIAAGNVGEEEIERVRHAWEKGLSDLQGVSGKQTLTHFGSRRSDEEAKQEFLDLMEYQPGQFVSTGLAGLDAHLHGFERGNLVTISAPRAGGKSTLGMVMSINQYLKSNHNVCYVSIEMSKREFLRRVVSNISKVPHDKVRVTKYMTREERAAAGVAFKKWQEHGRINNSCYTIWPVKDAFFTPQKVEVLLAPFMYDVIVVDYITLMHAKGKDTWQMQMEYSRYLSMMAKKLGCVIILLSQLSDDERVKYGKSIEENTDYWIWWRYGDEEEQTGNVELRLAKARHTRTARIPAQFMLDVMNIETASPAERDQRSRGGKGSSGRISESSGIWTNNDS